MALDADLGSLKRRYDQKQVHVEKVIDIAKN
jgi:hypothetical protein